MQSTNYKRRFPNLFDNKNKKYKLATNLPAGRLHQLHEEEILFLE